MEIMGKERVEKLSFGDGFCMFRRCKRGFWNWGGKRVDMGGGEGGGGKGGG